MYLEKKTIGLSDLLFDKHAKIILALVKILTDYKIDFDLLENTKDIWARDYMPIVTKNNNMVGFSYTPDYLKANRYANIRTNQEDIKTNGVKLNITRKSIIVLDGGTFEKLFEYILELRTLHNFTLIVDEFQELGKINSSIYSSVQKLWDLNINKTNIHFIACGSIYSLMKKIYEDKRLNKNDLVKKSQKVVQKYSGYSVEYLLLSVDDIENYGDSKI